MFRNTDIFKIITLGIVLFTSISIEASTDTAVFDDQTLASDIQLPEWFKLSFLDLKDDLDEAVAANKKGIIVYFGRKDCPYCKALLENNWGSKDIVYYTRKHFDVIAVDTKGRKNITDISGEVYNEQAFSIKKKTNFTPSLLFINEQGNEVFKLSGYHNPYRFMAALEFVAGRHYNSQNFKTYLSQAQNVFISSGKEELNNQHYFESPPYILDRTKVPASEPLVVFFEKKNCHACDILHALPLDNKVVRKKISDLNVVQLDIESDQLLITPDGKKTTGRQWSNMLDLHYTPTLIFFNEQGKEIIRIDSVVWLHRLERVLDYINTKAYKKYDSFQLWRQSQTDDK